MGAPFKKQTTTWKLDGKKVPPRTPGAEKITIESSKWYGTVNGEQVPLCRDKQSAQRMLRKLESDAALASVGLADPFADHRARPLSEHLNDFTSHLRAKGDTETHIELTIARVQALFDGCKVEVYGDIDAARASEWLTSLRQAAPSVAIPNGKAEFTPGEVSDLFGISSAGDDQAARFGRNREREGTEVPAGDGRGAGRSRGARRRAGDGEPLRPRGSGVLPVDGQGEAHRLESARFALADERTGGRAPRVANGPPTNCGSCSRSRGRATGRSAG